MSDIEVYAGNAAVYCTVRDGKVVKVTLLADQGGAEYMRVDGPADLSDDEAEAAITVVDTDTWQPLMGLPDDVVWEG